MPPPEPEHPPGRFQLFEAELEAELPDVDDELSMSEDAAENFRKQERASFQGELAEALKSDLRFSHVGWQFLSMIGKLKTPLGRFYKDFDKHAVAQGGPDLLPISLSGVEKLSGVKSFERDWLVMMCLTLNYQFCGQCGGGRMMEHSRELNPRQEQAIRMNLLPAVQRMIGDEQMLPSVDEIKAPPAECEAVSRHVVTIHLGKWRTWKEEELIAGGSPSLTKLPMVW